MSSRLPSATPGQVAGPVMYGEVVGRDGPRIGPPTTYTVRYEGPAGQPVTVSGVRPSISTPDSVPGLEIQHARTPAENEAIGRGRAGDVCVVMRRGGSYRYLIFEWDAYTLCPGT